MIYRFLESNRPTVVGPKQLLAVEDGFVIDFFPTSAGGIWFKTKMDWGDLQAVDET